MLPAVSRPPIPGVPGVRPIMPPVIRPAVVPTVTPAEKPQTTVYIGKIASSVDNDYMLSLLQVGFFFCLFSFYMHSATLGSFMLCISYFGIFR